FPSIHDLQTKNTTENARTNRKLVNGRTVPPYAHIRVIAASALARALLLAPDLAPRPMRGRRRRLHREERKQRFGCERDDDEHERDDRGIHPADASANVDVFPAPIRELAHHQAADDD